MTFPIDMGQDRFLRWTAPFAGSFFVEIVSADYAPRFAVYRGGDCTASCLGTSVANPFWQYWEVRDLQPGQEILVQIGGEVGQAGSGVLEFREAPCNAIGQDVFAPNDSCASAAALLAGFYPDLNVRYNVDDYFLVDVPAGHWLRLEDTTGQIPSVGFYLYGNTTCSGSLLRYGNGTMSWYNASGQTVQCSLRGSMESGLDTCRVYDLDVRIEPHPCVGAADDAFEDNDTCSTAVSLAPGFYPGLYAQVGDPDFFRVCLPPGESVTAIAGFDGQLVDLDLYLWLEGSSICASGNYLQALDFDRYHWDVAEVGWRNDTGAAVNVLLQVDAEPSTFPACNHYDLNLLTTGDCGQPASAVRFCDPMNPNSTGQSGRLDAYGDGGAAAGRWLLARNLPPYQFCYLLLGQFPAAPGSPVGQGLLCLSGGLGRFNLASGPWNSVGSADPWGVYRSQSGNGIHDYGFRLPSSLPLPGNPVIVGGSTWSFQLWHRENGGSSNLTNGVEVSF
ncbi:MAG: hypothetical protein R3E96_04335 [Planctomycetota bacterium]